jgi:cytochrome c
MLLLVVVAALGGAGLSACKTEQPPVRVEGSPDLGKTAIRKYGCGSCHTIPGVKGADALVGPPLVHFRRRSFIAGQLANTEANLRRWITDPQAVEPGTAMPKLDVTPEDARNIAAYLESLN